MDTLNKISSGIEGLDEILHGGLLPKKSYLIQGGPGSGKSTLGLHFLAQAAKNQENGLYISLGESEQSIRQNAQAMDINLADVSILDLSPSDNLDENGNTYSVFSPAEVEQQPLLDTLRQHFEELNPSRVVLDSITILRMLNDDAYQMRKLGLSLIKYITGQGATLLMISEYFDEKASDDSTFWVDGIIKLMNQEPWRKLQVSKFRGSDYMNGLHSFSITGSGITVFPQLRPNQYNRTFKKEQLSSGIQGIDHLLHGGIEKGTTNLLIGPTGVGKTNMGLQFIKQAAERNHRAVLYSFEESREQIIHRSKMVNIPIDDMIEAGNLEIVSIEPLSYSPDEFAKNVQTDIEEHHTQMVMIDSIGGYGMAVREKNVLESLHTLTIYLQNMGITTLLVNESQNITGDFKATNMNASYLADNIIFLRYLELDGRLKKAIGVLKKRLSGFENTIREFEITPDGIAVGNPLEDMRGILTGLPEHTA